MADFNKRNNNNRNKNPRKNNDYGTKKETRMKAPDVCAGTIEYQMSKTMADAIVKGSKSNRTPQEILCNYVNTQYGLKGYCVKVLVDLQ